MKLIGAGLALFLPNEFLLVGPFKFSIIGSYCTNSFIGKPEIKEKTIYSSLFSRNHNFYKLHKGKILFH